MKGAGLVRLLNRLAERHGGVITRQQAINLGAGDRLTGQLVRAGVWRRVHPGVFVLAGTAGGHATAVRAALAALGPEAVASHQSAAWLAGIADRPPGLVHVTVFDDRRRRLPGVRVHRCNQWHPGQAFQGVRCSSPARILIDVGGVLSGASLASMLDRALSLGLVRITDLDAATQAGSRARGAAALRRCLHELGHIGAPKPSVLESRMARLFIRYRLPRPHAEVVWGQRPMYRIDFAYPGIKLAVEVYGYAWHHSPDQLAHDLARHRRLVSQGWTVLPYTWRQVVDDPDGVAAEILAAHRRLSRAA
jgi:hypothetical protein